MLLIKPFEDKQTILPYAKKCKMPYSPALYLFLAKDGEEVLAACLFQVGGDRVQVLHYETSEGEDYYLFDAVLRAGLNYASEHGIQSGYIPESFRQLHGSLFGRINFPIQPVFDISNFFSKYKNCVRVDQ